MNSPVAKTYQSGALLRRVPQVCVAVAAPDAAEMLERAESVVRDHAFLELRLDYLKQPGASLDKIRSFIKLHSEAVLIATCRRKVNGGRFQGSLSAELQILSKAAAAGFQFVDLELQSAQALKAAQLAKIRAQAGLVISFHDFRATRELDEIYRKMEEIPADYYKIVTTATCLYDNVSMLKLLNGKGQAHPVVGLCMGEQGVISRVLSLRAGSAFTFAATSAGEETAPGQVSAQALRDLYRAGQLDAASRIYGVAGDPVAQSLSPVMMNAAFRRENINAVYLALHAKCLDDLVACVRDIPISGLSVTMPHKEGIIAYLSNSDALSRKTRACNTVVRAQDGRLFGFNTDVAGIVAPLQQRLPLAGAKVLVIGAGGAARAAVFGLRDRDADLYVLNRTPANALRLAQQAKAKPIKRTDLKKYAFDVIINATPLGMEAEQSPLSEKEIHARFVLDMVYTRRETPFTKAAQTAGAQVIPGLEMFVHQGARQFEIWTGKPAPTEEMLNAAASALS